MKLTIVLALILTLGFTGVLMAEETVVLDRGSSRGADVKVDLNTYMPQTGKAATEAGSAYGKFDSSKYTLGPKDVLEVEVLRHAEFSGKFAVNEEGKIQFKFVGDVDVRGMTKVQLVDKLKELLKQYVVSPEINVTIVEYASKVFYVIGEVAAPGQYVMHAETISLRDAIHIAGLPTINAAMRKCQLITGTETGHSKVQCVDVYSLLYRGNLKSNVMLNPGDILYVPATMMAKIIRIVSPISTTIGLTSSMPQNAASGRTAVDSIEHKKTFF